MPENGRQRLDSWGEIAHYLRRDIRTVKRWEKEKGLPVHRLPGGKRQVVFAYQDEIDLWASGSEEKDPSPVPDQSEPPIQEVPASQKIEQSPGGSPVIPANSSVPVAVSDAVKPRFLTRRKEAILGLVALAAVAVTAVLAVRSPGPQLLTSA